MSQFAMQPLANPRWSDVVHEPLFDASQCERIVGLLDSDRWGDAAIGDVDPAGRVDHRIRSARLQNLNADDRWPHRDLMAALARINEEVHRFRLSGCDPSDAPSIVRYDAGTNDHFRPHRDVGPTNSTRKLTYVVQLSDPEVYVGGDLVFPDLGLAAPRGRGTLIVFPSFLSHVVSPLVSGVRYALVSWLHGPTFA